MCHVVCIMTMKFPVGVVSRWFGVWSVLLLCATGADAISASCPYPVVLQPGFFGYRELPGVGHHFNTTPAELRAKGCVVVDAAPLLLASVTVRAQALGDVVAQTLATYGAEQVVIIGHSQGGLDALTMLQLRPELVDHVAAIATLSTPFRGTALADWAEVAPALVFPITTALAMTVDALQVQDMGSRDMNAEASFGSMHRRKSPRGRVAVPLFSVSGITGHDDDRACRGGVWSTPVTEDMASPMQVFGGLLLRTSGIGSHDGVVSVNSSKSEGRFLGCVPADHLDWGVGQHNSAGFAPAAFMTTMAMALQDVGREGPAAMDRHLPQLAGLARAQLVAPVATTAMMTTR
jgi:pimeloyl-ACP methyl ester carboxylesterase